jgi:protein-S-isoprenylcysteine O-methyltransferase Ste14
MIQPTKWRTRILLVLAALLGVGSVALFALWPLGTLRIARPQWPEPLILAWDALLSLVFFVQHSWMLRKGARARLATVIPPVFQFAVYATASGSPCWSWSCFGSHRRFASILSLRPGATWRTDSRSRRWPCSSGAFVRCVRSTPLGIRPLANHLRSMPSQPCPFAVGGAYRFVRHPLYLAILVLFWSNPDMTADRLLFDGLWTAWIVVGTFLEEADLIAELGDAYRSYQRSVPMLVPLTKMWAGRADPM